MAYRIGVDARCLEGRRTGAGRYLSNILKELGTTPDVVFYLYFKREIPPDTYFQEQAFKLQELTSPFGRKSNAFFTHVSLPRALKSDSVQMLFAPAYVAPWNCPVPVVLALHDISYEAHPEWTPSADKFFLRRASKHAAKRAAHIVTISEFSKKEIMRLYGVSSERITVTPLASDPHLKESVPDAEAKQILEKLGVGDNAILSVGSLINRRYPLVIIDAFAAVAKYFPSLQLVFVGCDRTHPPLYVQKHIEWVRRVLQRDAIRVLDSPDDRELAVLYQKAKMLLWLSAYEGFGLPPLEALSVGTPVITSNTSSLPEVVGDAAIRIGHPSGATSSTSGLTLVAGPTVGGVADAIMRVLRDEALRVWLTEKGKARAELFSWKRTAEQTLAVFRKALKDTKI